MSDINASTARIKAYVDDLGARLHAREQWNERHPDHESEQYEIDSDLYYRFGPQPFAFKSTFDPDDPAPNTSDLLSAQRFFDVAIIAVTALTNTTGEHHD